MPTTARPFAFGDFLVTRAAWVRKSGDSRQGDPRRGTAKMLALVDGAGTCLVPATVCDGLAFTVRCVTSPQVLGHLFCPGRYALAATSRSGGVLALIHRIPGATGFQVELPGASEGLVYAVTLDEALAVVYDQPVSLT